MVEDKNYVADDSTEVPDEIKDESEESSLHYDSKEVPVEKNDKSLETSATTSEEVETSEEEIPENIEKVRVFITNDQRNIKEVEIDVLLVLQQNQIIVKDKKLVLNYAFRKSFLFSIEAYNSEQIFTINDQLVEAKSKINIQIEL